MGIFSMPPASEMRLGRCLSRSLGYIGPSAGHTEYRRPWGCIGVSMGKGVSGEAVSRCCVQGEEGGGCRVVHGAIRRPHRVAQALRTGQKAVERGKVVWEG